MTFEPAVDTESRKYTGVVTLASAYPTWYDVLFELKPWGGGSAFAEDEATTDAIFQDFIDYVAAYPGAVASADLGWNSARGWKGYKTSARYPEDTDPPE